MIRNGLLLVVLAFGSVTGCSPAAEPAATKPAAGVCKHGVMDADCPFCHPDLVAKLGECKEHGVPEALCWICKPSLVEAYKANGDWCAEHAVPESKCKLCGK